jgi:hypothetical protein
MSAKSDGLNNGQIERVVRLLCLPAELRTLHAHEEDPVGDLVNGTAIGGMQAIDLALHAAPSFGPG